MLRIQAHHCGNPASQAVYSHVSAARLHGFSDWESGPHVHVTTAFSPSQASSGADVIAHGGLLERYEVSETRTLWGSPARVTSLERTVVDCARTLDFEKAVIIADQALRRGADPRILQDYLDSGRITRGARRLRTRSFSRNVAGKRPLKPWAGRLSVWSGTTSAVRGKSSSGSSLRWAGGGGSDAKTWKARCSVAGQQRNSGPTTSNRRREAKGYAETRLCQSLTRGRLCASETEWCATWPAAMLRPAASAGSRSNAALTPRLASATA